MHKTDKKYLLSYGGKSPFPDGELDKTNSCIGDSIPMDKLGACTGDSIPLMDK